MRHITEVVAVEQRVSKAGESYWVTTILDDQGDESQGYGKDFKVGERVEVFFHDRYNRAKFQRYNLLDKASHDMVDYNHGGKDERDRDDTKSV